MMLFHLIYASECIREIKDSPYNQPHFNLLIFQLNSLDLPWLKPKATSGVRGLLLQSSSLLPASRWNPKNNDEIDF